MSHPFEDLPGAVHIGEPVDACGLRLFPLYPTRPPTTRVLPLAGAVALGLAEVHERTRGGDGAPAEPWYRSIQVTNRGAVPVLLREGDLLVGGRQDRLVDRPALVPAGHTTPVAVSCVEQGRSGHGGALDLRVAEASADPALRRARLAPTGRPDQAETWRHVADRRRAAGLPRADGSLAEVAGGASAEALLAAFPPPYQATGVAGVGADGRVALLEWTCDPDAVRIVWSSLVRSLAHLARPAARPPRVSRTELRRLLERIARASARAQAEDDTGRVATVALGTSAGIGLSWRGEPVHLAFVA